MADVTPVRASKVKSLSEAAALVPDGARVAFGGQSVYQHPMAFVRELIIGAKTSGGGGGGFKGAIDDVRVYKRVLTAGEVSRLAAGDG